MISGFLKTYPFVINLTLNDIVFISSFKIYNVIYHLSIKYGFIFIKIADQQTVLSSAGIVSIMLGLIVAALTVVALVLLWRYRTVNRQRHQYKVFYTAPRSRATRQEV